MAKEESTERSGSHTLNLPSMSDELSPNPIQSKERVRPTIGFQTKMISDVVAPPKSSESGILKIEKEERKREPNSEIIEIRGKSEEKWGSGIEGITAGFPRAWSTVLAGSPGLPTKLTGGEAPEIQMEHLRAFPKALPTELGRLSGRQPKLTIGESS
jgi:hypothetical protein